MRQFLSVCLISISLQNAFCQGPDVIFDTANPFLGGLTNAMQLTNAADGSGRLFVAERAGIVKVFDADDPETISEFLDMNESETVVGQASEGGLLSIAFHPEFEDNGFMYAFYTNTEGNLVLARYTATGNTADPDSRFEIFTIIHSPYNNHNGGELHFGTDGYLYLSTGDGGSSNDPGNNALNPESWLGKILRIDVDGASPYAIPPGNPFPGSPVYVLGLRNPFRWSFDRVTGDMWIGDVGQNAFEEINHLTSGAIAGKNLGWRCMEGNGPNPAFTPATCPTPANYVAPIYTYPIGARGTSVIGGVVYRGAQYPAMEGYYIGADYSSGQIHKIEIATGSAAYQTSTIGQIVDIGEDEDNEIYVVTFSTIYRITAEEALPVTIVNFQGEPSVEGVSLTWQTSAEENFQQFEVEFSEDAFNFTSVGNVASENNIAGAKYAFSHVTSLKNQLYYRLKMVDKDQSFEHSRIIAVNTGDPQITGAFVRPSLIQSNTMNLVLDKPFETVELIGQNGQIFWREDISGKNGNISLALDQTTTTGIYTVRLADSDRSIQQKVLIVK